MSEYTPTTDQVRQIYTQMCELAACVGERPFGGAGSFDRYLAEHDRKVAAKAWGEGAIAAWNRSGKWFFGEGYEELNFMPLSIREANPYEQDGARD